MSTICRVKVHIESQQPFWMLINLEECRHIKDIFTKIQAVCPSRCAEDLFLDGCFLPPNEASRILRDNDTVHVKISDTSEVNTENTHVHNEQGKQKKKKSKHFIYDNHHGKQNKDRKWVCSNLDKEIEVKNSSEKKDGKTSNKCIVVSEMDMKNSTFVDSFHYFDSTSEVNVLRAVSEVPCSLPAVTLTMSDVKQDKMSSSSSVHGNNSDIYYKTVNASENSQRIMGTKSNMNLLSESSVTFSTKKKRKRKRTHKRKMENSCEKTFIFKEDKKDGSIFNTSSRMQSELKFTKSHKPPSKKIIFTSDEESFSEQHVTPICNDMNDSSNKIILENRESSCLITKDFDGIDPESNLIKNQQISFRLQQAERHLKTPSAFSRPIPVNNNGHDQLIHSDLATYLRMSPEERGITLPPYLKAERISNGAMMYIRTTHTPNSMYVQTSPPFKYGGEQKPEDKVHATFLGNGLFQQQEKSLRTVEEASMKLADNIISSKNMIMALPLYRDYSKFPDLQFPKAGDHIAFKVLELKEDYTPAVSEYKEAEILEYENHMKMVRIRLLKKNMEIKKKMPEKFDILDNTIVEEDVLELKEDYTPAVSEYKEAEILEYENHMKMVRIRLLKKNMEIKKKMPEKFDILDNTIVEEDVLELKEDYTPAVSEYKEAEILEYENHMKMVRIRLLKKNMEIKKKMPEKFDILDNTIVEEDVLELKEDYTPAVSEYKEAEILEYENHMKMVRIRLLKKNMEIKKKMPEKFDILDNTIVEEDVLELKEDYTPAVSEYKEAEILEYENHMKMVRIRLLKKNMEIKKKMPEKFDILDNTIVEEDVSLELAEMLEPKLLTS